MQGQLISQTVFCLSNILAKGSQKEPPTHQVKALGNVSRNDFALIP